MKGRPCACGECQRYIYAPTLHRKYHALCEWNAKRNGPKYRRYGKVTRTVKPLDDLPADEIDRIFHQQLAIIKARRRDEAA
jgi:hypothetical protein